MRTTPVRAGVVLALAVLAGACNSSSDSTTSAPATSAPATSAPRPTTPATSTPGTSAAATSLDAYCGELQAAIDGDPGFDAIFEKSAEPSLAEWAAFLPGPITKLRGWVEALEGIDPPADLVDEHDAVTEALRTVTDTFESARKAAAAGDQATFDRLTEQNQGTNLPAMEQAFGAVGTACGFPSDGEGGGEDGETGAGGGTP